MNEIVVKNYDTLRELIFAGINFYEFRKFLKKSRNSILAKIMKMCKLAKFPRKLSFSQVKIAFFLHFEIFLFPKIT